MLLLAGWAAGCDCAGEIRDPPGSDAGGGAGGGDAGDGRCSIDADCDGGHCQPSTGQCIARSCLTDPCDAGTFCDLSTLSCSASAPGPHPTYVGLTLAGHLEQERAGTRDAVGLSAMGNFSLLVATRDGRYLYVADDDEGTVVRYDQTSGRVETLCGIGWPGEANGPCQVAQFEVDFYQQGGLALTPDETALVLTDVNAIRKVDLVARTASTVTLPGSPPPAIRGMAIGPSGDMYLSGWSNQFWVLHPDGGFDTRTLTFPAGPDGGAWPTGARAGYLAVDEARGYLYGLDRNFQSGALYRWPILGGAMEWLNHDATGKRDPVQYLSDGPVAGLEMANPGGLSIDAQGEVYIGAGDGRTFRRYSPDAMLVESLCAADGGTDRFEWCIGDGVRNRLFGTWPSILAFDAAGNGYFGYSVWPRLVGLRREP